MTSKTAKTAKTTNKPACGLCGVRPRAPMIACPAQNAAGDTRPSVMVCKRCWHPTAAFQVA